MACFKKLAVLTVIFGSFYSLFTQDAYAYIDPGTGSFFLQLLIAGIIGAAFTIKLYWIKLRTFFSGLKSEERKHQREEDHD